MWTWVKAFYPTLCKASVLKWDGIALAKQQQRKNTRFSLVEKRINKSMALDFLSQGHREHCHGMSFSLQQAHRHPPEGSPFQHHSSTRVGLNVRLWWQRNRRILWQRTECHWSDTEEGHSCCARRLEYKAKMLVKTGKAFVDPSAMMTQMREESDFWSLPSLTITNLWVHWVCHSPVCEIL